MPWGSKGTSNHHNGTTTEQLTMANPDEWFDQMRDDYAADVQRSIYRGGRSYARPSRPSSGASGSTGGSADASDLAGGDCVADQPAPPAIVQFPSIPTTPIKGGKQ